MIVGICGTYDDTYSSGIRGNGKTCTMTALLKTDKDKSKREVYTNYYTTFSHVLTTQEIINLLKEGELYNTTVGIDEIQIIVNSLGTKGKIVNFIDSAIAQTRKYEVDLYYASQRFLNVNNRLRIQTDVFLLPEKRHLDNSLCCVDRCIKEHRIYVYSKCPFRREPIMKINPEIVGKYYNTRELVNESIEL